MRVSFLSLCAEHIFKKCANDLSKVCIVFPTRRAALFFRKELVRHINKPVFAPEILAVNDFVNALSTVQTTDAINLLFKLYKSYRTEFPKDTFNHYFHWGVMLLRDFNEMDMESTDVGKLFTAIHDLKDLESQFEWEAEEIAAVRKFWSDFSLNDPGLLQQSFLDAWKSVPAIYRHFHQSALDYSFATEGMVWRNAIASVSNDSFLPRWNKIYFCGFYFITRVHHQLVNALKQKAEVEFFYDADSYYSDDPVQEAGSAFRKLRTAFQFKGNNFSSQPKSITITGVPMGEMQVKTAGLIIRNWMREDAEKSTAIILPDEKLLLPLLNSLPEEVKNFNVTMGFPAQHTITGSFIRSLYDLHSYSQPSSGKFFCPVLIPVLTHPGMPEVFKKDAAFFHSEIIQSQILWIHAGQLSRYKMDELLTYSSKNANGVLDYLLFLFEKMAETENVFERSVALFIHEKISEIRPEISVLADEMDETAVWKVVMKIIRSLRIPFSGEPVAGIQIMGMLETRALDFDRFIILSANEGVLPGNAMHPSFIPYSLRKAFGMPVTEQHDAVYAYHFYRLLQRADEVHLIYDTEGKRFSGGEMSRFANQLMNEAEKKTEGNCKVVHRIVSAPLTAVADAKIKIRKSPEMMNGFSQKISDSENGLSASALATYMACKLRFYFHYIAGLKEPDELREIPGPEVLGNLLHHAMEILYSNKKQLSSKDIEAMKGKINQAVDSAFQTILQHENSEVTGYHFLNRQIVQKLVMAIIDTDTIRTPFGIDSLERNFKTEIAGGLNVRGVIDRLQYKDGVLEILDYKSGKAELTTDLEEVFSNAKYKAAFQLLYYAMLVRNVYKDIPLKAGLYIMRQLSGGITFLNDGEIISDELMDEFEDRLHKLIAEVLNLNIIFDQTEDSEQCKYCPYAAICKR